MTLQTAKRTSQCSKLYRHSFIWTCSRLFPLLSCFPALFTLHMLADVVSNWSARLIHLPRGRDPFDKHKNSQPLAGPDFLRICRVLVLYSQPTGFSFFRLDGKSNYRIGQRSRFLLLTKRIAGSGDDNAKDSPSIANSFYVITRKSSKWVRARRRTHKPTVVAFLQDNHFIAFLKAQLIFINRFVTEQGEVPGRDKHHQYSNACTRQVWKIRWLSERLEMNECLLQLPWEEGMALRWERSPPTNVAQVRFRLGDIYRLSLSFVLALLWGFSWGSVVISKFLFDQDRGPHRKGAVADVSFPLNTYLSSTTIRMRLKGLRVDINFLSNERKLTLMENREWEGEN